MDHSDPVEVYLATTPLWKIEQDRSKAIAKWQNGKSVKLINFDDAVKLATNLATKALRMRYYK